jgi:hypothetical protein
LGSFDDLRDLFDIIGKSKVTEEDFKANEEKKVEREN